MNSLNNENNMDVVDNFGKIQQEGLNYLLRKIMIMEKVIKTMD